MKTRLTTVLITTIALATIAVPAHADTRFVTDMRAVGFTGTSTQITRLGNAICSGLRSGVTVTETINAGIDAGFTGYQAGSSVGYSVGHLCPDQSAKVDSFLGATA